MVTASVSFLTSVADCCLLSAGGSLESDVGASIPGLVSAVVYNGLNDDVAEVGLNVVVVAFVSGTDGDVVPAGRKIYNALY